MEHHNFLAGGLSPDWDCKTPEVSVIFCEFAKRFLYSKLCFRLCFEWFAKANQGGTDWGVQAIGPSFGAQHQNGWERLQTC